MDVVGRTILYRNGLPVAQCKEFSYDVNSNAKAVKGMSPTGGPIGTVDGTPEITLDCTFYIPKTGELVDWVTLKDAVFVARPRDGLGPTFTFFSVFFISQSGSFSEDSEATRKVKLGALRFKEL